MYKIRNPEGQKRWLIYLKLSNSAKDFALKDIAWLPKKKGTVGTVR